MFQHMWIAGVLVVFASAAHFASSEDCYDDYERAQGEAGYPPVDWKPCCNLGSTQEASTGRGYGKFCIPPTVPKCYGTGERAQGAPGHPSVQWLPCCDADAEQIEDPSMGWGKFCKTRDENTEHGTNADVSDDIGGETHDEPEVDCYGEGERAQGTPGHPPVQWLPCCDADAEQIEDPLLGWGKFCKKRDENTEHGTTAGVSVDIGGGTHDDGPVPDCYGEGERAEGAVGYPAVQWLPCCDADAETVEDPLLGWGRFCKKVSGSKIPRAHMPEANTNSTSWHMRGKDKVWKYLNATGEPHPRHEASFVMGDDGKAFLLGSRGIKPVDVYDLKSSSWSSRSQPPEEIHHFQAVFSDGKIWIPSSWTGNYPYESNVDKFYVYDTTADTWDTRTPIPEERRRGGAAVALRGDEIYVGFGNRGGHGPHSTSYGWLDVYNITSDSWSVKADASFARDHTGGGIVGDKFCVAGGRDGGAENPFEANVAPAECYNIVSGQWETKSGIPIPRAGSSYGVDCDGRLVVAGGEGNGLAYDRVDYFNGEGWDTSTTLKRARHGSGVAVGNCACCECRNMYVASGSGAQGGSPELKSIEKFTDELC